MVKSNYQKIKLLKLWELLRQETNEAHPLTTNQICQKLVNMGISCDRRTLANDIALLNEFGYEVMSGTVGHNKCYYVEDRSFSLAELKILIDAVQASSFITKKKTEEMTEKLANLGGSFYADLLKNSLLYTNTKKHSNESIFYNVDALEKAVREYKKITFNYFDLDEKGEKVYRKNKALYTAEPIALVFNEGNYYLVCYTSKYNELCTYRVDKMTSVEISEENISEEAVLSYSAMQNYTENAFKMYDGYSENIALSFDKSLMGVIHDKFGENTKITKTDDDTFTANVTVQISPAFWGWLFQFSDRMVIAEPEYLAEEYCSLAETIFNLYESDGEN
ncbi:MAG: transcriptional regulator [Clostridiales bacterium]|nr:transcriptional regulator [Clostridiales bacterium]